MLLLLQPSARQQKDLDTLLTHQQARGNVQFHKWLTPNQFAACFANSPADVAIIVTWLQSQGFTVAPLPAGRQWIEFSGTAGQVERVFAPAVPGLEFFGQIPPIKLVIPTHVELAYSTNGEGESRYRLQGEINLPESIAPMVKGLVSLDGALAQSTAIHPVPTTGTSSALAAESSTNKAQAMTPSLAEPWLHLQSVTGSTGAGETIVIPSRSSIRVEDVAAFRKSFGLSESAVEVQFGNSDPGRTADEAATTLAASWAGVAAPGAKIVVLAAATTNATDGLDLALAAAVDSSIDGVPAHTISVGYSACESALSPAHQAFYAAVYRQAAAEGISIVAATGDSGAAACQFAGDTVPVSTGRAVNALASTPWNIAVGASAFTTMSGEAAAWGQTESSSGSSATGNSFAYAAGGGASSLYTTPDWQSASGLPASDPGTAAAHHRYLPDVALPVVPESVGAAASDSSMPDVQPTTNLHGLAFCFAGNTGANGCRLVSGGGSGAASAIFAGVSALLAEKYGAQGNLAPNLYALSRSQKSATSVSSQLAFSDIITGAALLPCAAGSPDCPANGQIGFAASTGYDLATGLGTVNAKRLVAIWATPLVTGTATATVEMTTIGGVTYNPSANITLSAKVISGSGGTVPTGTVQFFDETNGANTGSPVTLAADGTASYTEQGQFSIGGHNIQAQYSGDSNYAAGSSQPITINIQPSATSLVVSPNTITPSAGSTIIVTGTVTSSNLGASPPTGSLTVNLDGIAQGTQRFTTTDNVTTATVNVTAPSGGSHTIQGTYSGDINYNNSTASSVTITVAKSATVTTLSATPSTLSAGTPETLTATVAPLITATGATYTITGTVSFYDGTTLLGVGTLSSNTAILPSITLSASAVHTLTAVYAGDTSYTTSTSSPLILEPVLLPVTVTLTSNTGVLAPGQSASLTVTVTPVSAPAATAEQHPTGSVFFYAGTTLIGTSALGTGAGYTGTATLLVPTLPAGAYSLTALYAGDTTYGSVTSNALSLQVEDFAVSCAVSSINIVQGATATISCNVAAAGGFAGPIQVLCEEQNPPQNGPIACTFDPNVVQGTGTTALTVVTTAGDISRNDMKPLWPAAGGGATLACLSLLLWPSRRRRAFLQYSRAAKLLMLTLLLAGFAGAGVGCTNSITKVNKGTPLGEATLKITAAANVSTVTVSHNAYLTVNVTP